MQTTTKTTYRAISPITGREYTRKSHRSYGFAVICTDTVETTAARLRADTAFVQDYIAEGYMEPTAYVMARIADRETKIANQYRAEGVGFSGTRAAAEKAAMQARKNWDCVMVVDCTTDAK